MTNSDQDTNLHKVEIRSEEVQEIMGHTPRWIIRWGITLVFVIIAGILAGSWFFKYPDVIPSRIIITTEYPPATVVAKASGKLQAFFVSDKQVVTRNQPLAVIENPARYQEIFQLKDKLNEFQEFIIDFNTTKNIDFENNLSLGEVQSPFAAFLKHYQAYQNFLEIKYHAKKISSIREEIKKFRLYYNRLCRQRDLLRKELELVERQFNRDSVLFQKKVIPQAEFDQSESRLLQKKHEFEQARINLSTTDIQISKLEQSILDYELEFENQKKQLELQIIESFDNLSAQIALWEQTYLLKAPNQGVVTLTTFWTQDQNVTIGDKVITIVPEDAGKIIGKMNLPLRRSGKVKVGQRVNIKLDNYPHMEFGMVNGIVRNISLVPADNFYTVEVELPDGLTTFYNINLEFDQEMQGMAEIITEERRLLIRIVEPVRYVLERNVSRREKGDR
ncbi:MAG: HlyD family efflux transporter periplasmic adaptor subunit [Bacteroidetes bacterium]|nr:HlyD family efflux transporter periplasmic adaptor subunit [Bacteroidota bacterium]